jgi:hypothetical protein
MLLMGLRGSIIVALSHQNNFSVLIVWVVFAGKDASRALAQSSLKPEDCRPDYEDLGEKEKKVLDEWMVFFSKRYNVVGKVVG